MTVTNEPKNTPTLEDSIEPTLYVRPGSLHDLSVDAN